MRVCLLRYVRFVADCYGNPGRFRLICDSGVFLDSRNGVLLFFISEGLSVSFAGLSRSWIVIVIS